MGFLGKLLRKNATEEDSIEDDGLPDWAPPAEPSSGGQGKNLSQYKVETIKIGAVNTVQIGEESEAVDLGAADAATGSAEDSSSQSDLTDTDERDHSSLDDSFMDIFEEELETDQRLESLASAIEDTEAEELVEEINSLIEDLERR